MNYRHLFHAGNFADLMKHAVLVALLAALSRKDKPWCYYDTHAGSGLYDLTAEAAVRTGEAASGIGRLYRAKPAPPEPVATLLGIVAASNAGLQPGQAPRYYPGSPMIAAALARSQDRLVLAERHPDEAARLRDALRHDKRVAIHERDGYEMIRALVPPAERRGLVLMDPPFERDDEFAVLADTCLAAQARWADGVYVLWYPVKESAPVARLHRRLQQGSRRPVVVAELAVAPSSPASLTASGLVIVNPPWQTGQTIANALDYLRHQIGPEQGRASVTWLVEE